MTSTAVEDNHVFRRFHFDVAFLRSDFKIDYAGLAGRYQKIKKEWSQPDKRDVRVQHRADGIKAIVAIE